MKSTVKSIVEVEGYSGSMPLKQDAVVEARSLDVLYQTILDRKDAKWALQDNITKDEVDEIISNIINGTTIGVIGGSFKSTFGTTSWVLKTLKVQSI